MTPHNLQALKYYQFKALLLQTGWLAPAYVGVDKNGVVCYLDSKSPEVSIATEVVQGFALPGFQNAHSHAFQYGMAGMAEKHAPDTNDDFWSWREAMYECALSMSPEHMQQVAQKCYRAMIRKGYTSVAEFHYVHHDQKGNPYDNLCEMGERLLEAAQQAGIKITLIPIFYQKGNFATEPYPRQRRFISKTIDDYFHLLDDSAEAVKKYSNARLGMGVHSLRAVDALDIQKTIQQGPQEIPFHMHAAEQLKEVDDCLAAWKQRPVEWLLNHVNLSDRFHLVHCTHLSDDEVRRLAQTGAHAVLCPGTEGNLGDGIFRLTDFAKHNGSWSIGTDSHISLNPLEDLRWLDYAQRLTTHKRNTFDDGAKKLIATTLFAGRKAMGGFFNEYVAMNQPLDLVVYDARSPLIAQAQEGHALQAILYTADSSDVLGTMVNGKWVYQR